MMVILDVSAAVEMILRKDKSPLFRDKFKTADWVVAPDLYVSEITNVLWKYYMADTLSHEECVQYVDDGIKMVDDFIDARDLWKEALGESIKNGHPVYDMLYAVLTRRNDATLLTSDKSLAGICKKMRIHCIS